MVRILRCRAAQWNACLLFSPAGRGRDVSGAAAGEGVDNAGPAEKSGSSVAAPRRLNDWLTIVAAAAMGLFVGLAAFAGAVCQPYLADRATAANARRVARTAAATVTTLWTYTPDTIDSLSDRAVQYLGGDFRAQYRKFLEVALTSTKQAQLTNKTDIVGVGVESLKGIFVIHKPVKSVARPRIQAKFPQIYELVTNLRTATEGWANVPGTENWLVSTGHRPMTSRRPGITSATTSSRTGRPLPVFAPLLTVLGIAWSATVFCSAP
jgi:hypothetical protein